MIAEIMDSDFIKNFPMPTHRRPTTPGEFIRDFLDDEELRLTQRELAVRLGITRPSLSSILNGKRAISVEMAFRLERVLGPSAALWLRMQMIVDLWDLQHSPKAKAIAKLKPLKKRRAA
jgi:addiction module HigA family antidote